MHIYPDLDDLTDEELIHEARKFARLSGGPDIARLADRLQGAADAEQSTAWLHAELVAVIESAEET